MGRPRFLTLGNAKEIPALQPVAEGGLKDLAVQQARQVQLLAGLVPDRQGADRHHVVFPEPGLEELVQVEGRPGGDQQLLVLEDVLDLLGQVGRRGVEGEVLPLERGQALAGGGLLHGGQEPAVGLAQHALEGLDVLVEVDAGLLGLVGVQVELEVLDVGDDGFPGEDGAHLLLEPAAVVVVGG